MPKEAEKIIPEIISIKEKKELVEEEIEELEEPLKVPESEPIEVLEPTKEKTTNIEDDLKIFKHITSAPTHSPRDPLERIKIYKSGSTYRIYIYDEVADAWHYVNLT